MAKATFLKKIEAAQKAYTKAVAGLAGEMRKEIAAVLAPLIPEGWFLYWEQKDDCYNDEDYYFDIQGACIATVREPKQGDLLEAAKPVRTETRTRPRNYGYGQTETYEHVLDHGSDEVYAWHLDPKGEKRDPDELDTYGGDPGILPITEDAIEAKDEWPATACGLEREAYDQIVEAFNALEKTVMRQAFGDNSNTCITSDGKIKINEFDSNDHD